MKERELHSCFYTSSLNHKATSSLPGQPKPSFNYIQKFYKSHMKVTLLNKETQDFWLTQKFTPTPCKNHIYKLEITLDKQPEAQEQQNPMVTLPSQPHMCSSS